MIRGIAAELSCKGEIYFGLSAKALCQDFFMAKPPSQNHGCGQAVISGQSREFKLFSTKSS